MFKGTIKMLTSVKKKKNLPELSFLFKISLSNFLFPFAKMVNSSKVEILLQFKRWLPVALSCDGLVFLKTNTENVFL